MTMPTSQTRKRRRPLQRFYSSTSTSTKESSQKNRAATGATLSFS